MTKRAQALAMLDELYAQIPAIECKGLCADSCTVTHASRLERDRISDVTGVELGPTIPHRLHLQLLDEGRGPRCPALGALGTCTVYEVRPYLCRAFGTVLAPGDPHGGLMCEHGCMPDAVISPVELVRVLADIERLSDEVYGVSRPAPWASRPAAPPRPRSGARRRSRRG